MKKTNTLYWIFTGLYAVVIFSTAIPNILSTESSAAIIVKQMGYPAYFMPFIGVAKCLGAIALVIPTSPRVKEWAYAGLAFDLVAVIYSFMALGLPIISWLPMFLFVAVLACSYIFYRKRLNAQLKPAKN